MALNEQITSPRSACNCSDSSEGDTSSADSITNNGGFIVMSAALSIIIPLVCVLVIQLRKAKLAERARLEAEARAARNGRGSELDLPPAYEQVFGPNFSPPTTIDSRSDSLEILIDNNAVRQAGTGNSESESRLGNLLRGHPPPNVSNVDEESCVHNNNRICPQETNNGHFNTPVTNLSDSYISEIASALQQCITDDTSSSERNIPTFIDVPISRVSSEPRTGHSTASTLLSSSSHPPAPPPYSPLPQFSGSNVSTAIDYITVTSDTQQAFTAHPGMHVPIADFVSSICVIPDGDISPPSYEEALKILETVGLAKDLDHSVK